MFWQRQKLHASIDLLHATVMSALYINNHTKRAAQHIFHVSEGLGYYDVHDYGGQSMSALHIDTKLRIANHLRSMWRPITSCSGATNEAAYQKTKGGVQGDRTTID